MLLKRLWAREIIISTQVLWSTILSLCVCVFVCMRVFRGAKSVILRLGVTVWISSVLINQSKKKSGSAETFLVYAPLVPLSLWHHHVSSCFSVSITLTNSHTYSPLIVITHLTSSVFVLLLPSVFVFSLYCLCFIECRCDYGLLCLSDRCQGHSIFTTQTPRTHTHTHTHEQPTAAWCVVNRSVTGDSLGGWSVSEISLQSCHWHIHVVRINTFGSCHNF